MAADVAVLETLEERGRDAGVLQGLQPDATCVVGAVKTGGGLNYVTGPMGAGKSLYGVRRIVLAVCNANYAVTNVELLPGWADRVAFHVAPHRGKAKRSRMADKLLRHYVYDESLQDAMRYRLPGRGEGRGVFVWDESHNDLNNRNWRDEGRSAILEWGTQLRKLGFVGYLLSQHADNTDAALRRVCNFQVRLQNQKEQTRFLGMRVTPWPLFLAAWFPTNIPLTSKVAPMRVERYFLGWHRHLYDTHGLYHGLDIDTGVSVISLPAGGLPPSGGGSRHGEVTGSPVIPTTPDPITAFAAPDGTLAN